MGWAGQTYLEVTLLFGNLAVPPEVVPYSLHYSHASGLAVVPGTVEDMCLNVADKLVDWDH